MVKLFQAKISEEAVFCFAPNEKTAIAVIENAHQNKCKCSSIKDVTQNHLKEDGVEFLIEKQFVGIPQVSIFMLNGSMMARESHYGVKQRSERSWWSDQVEGSKEAWGH